ncbi:MAG TPA: hypothetical protein VHP81_00320 [Lachnospiraceae bacterium]|nr:hypothetical protein [Lachnospiraceae bacterium]
MFIDDSLVLDYLQNRNSDSMGEHWIFSNIEEGQHLYEKPDSALCDAIENLYRRVIGILKDFTPFNERLISSLFPNWRSLFDTTNILLIVGCPNPYDAMVRQHDGVEYIIFDLIRFQSYVEQGDNVEDIVRRIITHECIHSCIHKDYPVPKEDYKSILKHAVFDEGFAHLLAFRENIEGVDLTVAIEKDYRRCLKKLSEAISETNVMRQSTLLEESISGPYWEKFGAISAKLFLAKNIDRLEYWYQNGIDNFMQALLREGEE